MAISLSPMAYFAGIGLPDVAPSVAPQMPAPVQPAPVADAAPVPSARFYDRSLVDPTPALKPDRLVFAHNAPLAGAFRPPPAQRDPVQRDAQLELRLEPPMPPAPPVRQEPAQPPVVTAEVLPPVPLPVPRPPDLQAPKAPEPRRMAEAPAAPPLRSAALPSAPVNNPSFFEKLFGLKKPAAPPDSALSYASLDAGGGLAPSAGFGSAPSMGAGTAVYDISARVVIMPNGERLEAHSGLGDKLDDARYVNVRMRGPTPPGTYVLTERESLFHGVRALRLTPVGGSAAIYGRDGILAHTYMLGPKGDSNGCVSFRNYDRFLQAYLRGEVKRLVVVAGHGQDLVPPIVNNRGNRLQRSARNT